MRSAAPIQMASAGLFQMAGAARVWLALSLLAVAPGCGLLGQRPAWELPPPPAREAPVVQPGALQRVTLDNGLRVLSLEDRRLPRVVLGVTARRGAGSVAPSDAGLASFTAELMKRGAGRRDALGLARAVDEIGATLQVGAGWDSMTVTVTGLSRDLDRLTEILADVVRRPRFDAGEGEKARGQQLAGLEQGKDQPATLAGWATARALYPDHRYGRPLEGTPESVAKLGAADAKAFHARVFVPDNAIVFASGDVGADDWHERARRHFGSESGWSAAPAAPETPSPPAEVPAQATVVVVDRPDLGQAHVVIGQGGISRTSDVRISAQLMNDVLGGSGFSSRLMASVRSDEGLTYGVHSGFAFRRQPGPYRVVTFTRAPEVRRMVDLLISGIEGIQQDPPSEDELAKAKSYLVGRFGLSLETSASVLASLVDLDVYGLPDDSLDTYRARVRAVQVADTTAAARDLLHPRRSAIVVVGPAETLVPLLEGLGPVEVRQP